MASASSTTPLRTMYQFVPQGEELTPEQIKQVKGSWTHYPARLASRQGVNGLLNTKTKKGKKSLGNDIISKAYAAFASRPIARPTLTQQVYSANMRTDYPLQYTTSTSVPTFGQFSFALSQLAGYAEYTGLFDQYLISELEVWIDPALSLGSTASNIGEYVSAVDLDDATTPTTYAMVADKQSAVETAGQAGHYHRWAPHVAVALYSGAFTSFGNEPPGWIDVASPSVLHYGLKLAFNITGTALNYNLAIRARVHFKQAGI